MLNHWAKMARQHWAKFLPNYYSQLIQNGTLQKELEAAGEKTDNMIADLMESGMRRNEAMEIVLPQFILLTPEKDREQILAS